VLTHVWSCRWQSHARKCGPFPRGRVRRRPRQVRLRSRLRTPYGRRRCRSQRAFARSQGSTLSCASAARCRTQTLTGDATSWSRAKTISAPPWAGPSSTYTRNSQPGRESKRLPSARLSYPTARPSTRTRSWQRSLRNANIRKLGHHTDQWRTLQTIGFATCRSKNRSGTRTLPAQSRPQMQVAGNGRRSRLTPGPPLQDRSYTL
jgi:hypothetical protein